MVTIMPVLFLNLDAAPLRKLLPERTQPHTCSRRAPTDGGADCLEAHTCKPESKSPSILLTKGAEPAPQVDGAIELADGIAAQLPSKAGFIGVTVEA